MYLSLQIPVLEGVFVVDIAVGASHSLALSDKGEVSQGWQTCFSHLFVLHLLVYYTVVHTTLTSGLGLGKEQLWPVGVGLVSTGLGEGADGRGGAVGQVHLTGD